MCRQVSACVGGGVCVGTNMLVCVWCVCVSVCVLCGVTILSWRKTRACRNHSFLPRTCIITFSYWGSTSSM